LSLVCEFICENKDETEFGLWTIKLYILLRTFISRVLSSGLLDNFT